MIKIVKDNTNLLYYTECRKCRSSFTYEYCDVSFEDMEYIDIVKRSVECPICQHSNNVDLVDKDHYSTNTLPYVNPFSFSNCCCTGDKK